MVNVFTPCSPKQFDFRFNFFNFCINIGVNNGVDLSCNDPCGRGLVQFVKYIFLLVCVDHDAHGECNVYITVG